MPDIKKKCKGCRETFILTEDDQEFFQGIAEKLLAESKLEKLEDFKLPERCIDCRRKRRAMRREQE